MDEYISPSRESSLVSNVPQVIRYGLSVHPTQWKLWGVALRQEREYLPFSIELLDIENEYYQGTEIPFNFESDINLHLEGNQTRRALVYMNTPLTPRRADFLPIPNE